MSNDASQGQKVTVEAVALRLIPCNEHAKLADGIQHELQNPNGYRHDCPVCAAQPIRRERI